MMTVRVFWSWSVLLLSFLIAPQWLCHTVAENDEAPKEPYHVAIMKWVRSNGGFINEKQEVRPHPLDPASGSGVYATERIAKGEILCFIPTSVMITPNEPDGGYCELTKTLEREMKLGESSKYAPYIRYMNAQPYGQLPESWSKVGLSMLRMIVGESLPMTSRLLIPDFLEANSHLSDYHEMCADTTNDPFELHVALLIPMRCENDNLIAPFQDLYNHRNGHWTSARQDFDEQGNIIWTSIRDIQAGEEIYHSYNMCVGCYGRMASGYGTMKMLQDYGFIEDMPQRWVLGLGLQFDIDEKQDGSGKMELSWMPCRQPLVEDMRVQLKFLHEERQRLDGLENVIVQGNNESDPKSFVPDNEWGSISRCYDSLKLAIRLAIEATEKNCLLEAETKDDCSYEIVRKLEVPFDTLWDCEDDEDSNDSEDFDSEDAYYDSEDESSSDDARSEF